MKLTAKWALWFVLVTIYAAVIGGLFYYNLFKFVFDKKLQNEMVEMVRYRAPSLVPLLAARPRGEATFQEADIVKGFRRTDDRIKNLIYLNYDGSVRWHENMQFARMSYDEYNNSVGFDTNAVAQAIRDRVPRAIMFGNGDYYDMAIPLLAKDTVAGVIDVTVSRENARSLINSSMVRYAFGAFIMILLIGGVLYLFLLLKVIRPLQLLRDSIEAVSFNNLTLSYPQRNDEIGDTAEAVENLLGRMQEELKRFGQKEETSTEKEQSWWGSLLTLFASPQTRAMVLDEENTILYANFDLTTFGKTKVHLLDVFDGRQQGVIEAVGKALEEPGKIWSVSATDKDVKYKVKVVLLPDKSGKNRVVLMLEPEK